MSEPAVTINSAAEIIKLAKQGVRTHGEFLGHFINGIGGPEGFAAEVIRLYKAAPLVIQLSFMRFIFSQIDINTKRGEADLDLDTANKEDIAHAIQVALHGRKIPASRLPARKGPTLEERKKIVEAAIGPPPSPDCVPRLGYKTSDGMTVPAMWKQPRKYKSKPA